MVDYPEGERTLSFECAQCGECCSLLGQVFEIIDTYENYAFLIRNQYTGSRHHVSITPSLIHLYHDKEIFIDRPDSCPFFRKNPDDGLYYCIVHLTRPEICQEYGCWRFLILDSQGNRAGRVMQSRHLHAENPRLQELWDANISTLQESNDTIWDQKMCDLVRKAGFQIKD